MILHLALGKCESLQHFKRMDFEVMEDIRERWMGHFLYFFKKRFIDLAAPGLGCGTGDF